MSNGQPEQPEIKQIVVKEELEKARRNLHNMRFQVTMQESIVKKLEELSR